IKAGLRQRTIAGEIVPAVCGSSFKNKGVPLGLDAVIDYLPAPDEIPAIQGVNPHDEEQTDERHADDNEPFSALAFKIALEPCFCKLTFAWVVSGLLTTGDSLVHSVEVQRERVGRVEQVHACQREEIMKCGTDDIAALFGMKDDVTGVTVCW